MGRRSALITLLLATACGDSIHPAVDGASPPDAGGHGPPDADLVNFAFTGRYLDWDSTAAAPCPIVGSQWTAHYDGSRVATTDDNGVFTILLASYLVELDIQPPTLDSACTTPQSRYAIPANAIVPPAVFYAGGTFVARSLTMARVATFYASFGSSFDETRANLLVHIDGTPRPVSISSVHAIEQAFDGTTWSAGASGLDVYFPNIEITGGSSTTVVVDGAIGAGSVPLAAGTITYMTVVTDT